MAGAIADLRTQYAVLSETKRAAEAASIAKSAFLANMGHEIRTPLNGVLGMAQVMELGVLAPEQREHLQVIKQSGQSLLTLLSDLLDLAKIDAGNLQLTSHPFDMAQVAKAVAADVAPPAQVKALSFILDVDSDVEGEWLGDRARIGQVIRNLVLNAVKFTDQGAVRLSVATDKGGAGGLSIEVADTGIGIAADRLPELLQRFVQADATPTRRHGGSGLGLAICRELVQMMGGSIDISSEAGVGTTVRLRIPLRRASADAAGHAAPPVDAGRGFVPLRRPR